MLVRAGPQPERTRVEANARTVSLKAMPRRFVIVESFHGGALEFGYAMSHCTVSAGSAHEFPDRASFYVDVSFRWRFVSDGDESPLLPG
jgi:hypothetical protein